MRCAACICLLVCTAEIFNSTKSKYKKRNSSGNWMKDRTTTKEDLAYKKQAGYKKLKQTENKELKKAFYEASNALMTSACDVAEVIVKDACLARAGLGPPRRHRDMRMGKRPRLRRLRGQGGELDHVGGGHGKLVLVLPSAGTKARVVQRFWVDAAGSTVL